MEPKCPFSDAVLGAGFGWRHALAVTERTGPAVHCGDSAALQRCCGFEQSLRRQGIPAFGVEDDLGTMPQSVLVKVHCGGLLGLADRYALTQQGRVADIDALLLRAEDALGLENLPIDSLVPAMTAYKLRRRRG